MRLIELSVLNFGALGTRTIALGGRSAVLLGVNEAGKTTLSDALLCALFGVRGGNTGEGQYYALRYGSSFGAKAVFELDGRRLESSDRKPCGAEHFDETLFRQLLSSRAGVVRFDVGDPQLDAALSESALGEGRVSLDKAKSQLKKVFGSNRSLSWTKRLERAREEESRAESKLRSILDLGKEADALDKAKAEAAGIGERIRALEASKAGLAEARRAAEAEALLALKARRQVLEDKARALSCEGLPPLERLATDANEVTALRLDLEGRQKQRDLHAESARTAEAQADEFQKTLRGMPDPARLETLASAHRGLAEAGIALDAAKKAGGIPAWVPALAAAAAGVVLGFLGWKLGGKAAGLAGALIGAASAWFLAARKDGGSAVREAERSAKRELDRLNYALRSLGWAMSPEEASRHCDDKLEERSRLEIQREQALLLAADSRQAARAAEAEVDKVREELRARQETVDAALRSWKANDMAAAQRRHAEWEGAKADLRTWEADVRRRLACRGDVLEALEKRLLELKDASAPEGLSGLEPAGLDRKEAELEAALQQSRAELSRLQAQAQSLELRIKTTEAQQGTGPEVLRARAEAVRERELVEAWRSAAQDAYRLLDEIGSDASARMSRLFELASPFFVRLTGGRYTGVSRAKDGSPDLVAVHSTEGARPRQWLSTGTEDALWLSVRLALARKAMPQGGLIVLDEPLHSMDPARAGKALEALFNAEELKDFQVLVLTKDDRLAELAEKAGALKKGLLD